MSKTKAKTTAKPKAKAAPKRSHPAHESRQERQNRLRSRHMRQQLAVLTDGA